MKPTGAQEVQQQHEPLVLWSDPARRVPTHRFSPRAAQNQWDYEQGGNSRTVRGSTAVDESPPPAFLSAPVGSLCLLGLAGVWEGPVENKGGQIEDRLNRCSVAYRSITYRSSRTTAVLGAHSEGSTILYYKVERTLSHGSPGGAQVGWPVTCDG